MQENTYGAGLVLCKVVCFHEAAHAVCAWYLGFEVAQVQVLSDSSFRQRRWLHDRFGRVLSSAAGNTEYRRKPFSGFDMFARNGACTITSHGKCRLAIIFAGPIMTAIHEGESLNYAFSLGGSDDRKIAHKTRSFGKIDQKTTAKIIEETAIFLISPAGSKAIHEVARRLFLWGRVSGSQLNMLCRQAFKVRCGVDPTGGVGPKGFHDANRALLPQLMRRSYTPP